MAAENSTSTSLHHLDIATARVQQVQAILHAITGEGFESFGCLNENMQHNYLYLAAELIDELKESVCWLALNNHG
jgi:hypothetical protein